MEMKQTFIHQTIEHYKFSHDGQIQLPTCRVLKGAQCIEISSIHQIGKRCE